MKWESIDHLNLNHDDIIHIVDVNIVVGAAVGAAVWE